MNSTDIYQLIERKHYKDICVPECKTGATITASRCPRLDVWVMAKSWANPLAIGYEIKVSRNDFLHDTKWQSYLPFCNELYFVCPQNIIQKDEVPENCGLMWVSKSGTMLFTKKKAAYRDVEIPPEIYKYILMSRAKIVQECMETREQYWRQWLADAKLTHDLGYRVSHKLRKLIDERIEKVEAENKRLIGEQERLADIKEFCIRYNVSLWHYRQDLEKFMENGIIKDVLKKLEDTKNYLDNKIKAIDNELSLHTQVTP